MTEGIALLLTATRGSVELQCEAMYSVAGQVATTRGSGEPVPLPQLSITEISHEHQQMGPAMPLGPNPHLRFLALVPQGLAPKASRLGTREPYHRNPPTTQKENRAIWNSAKDSELEKPAYPPEATPTLRGLLDTNPETDSQADPRPQLSPKGSSHQWRQIGPAMPLVPNLNPTLHFLVSVPRDWNPRSRDWDT